MNKIYNLGIAVATIVAMTACNDFLDDNRLPLTQQINNPSFWSTSMNVENQCNSLYENYAGYGNGTGTASPFYFSTLNDDQAGRDFSNWTYTNVPSSASSWNSPYTQIRHCNLIIAGIESAGPGMTEAEKANFMGIARMNRAYQYYQLVRCYGDVPVVEKPLDPSDTEMLYGPRVDRDKVMDLVLEDLDYAIANITSKGKQVWSADMARAMKSEICLYEGTYCKYRTTAENHKAPDMARATKYLTEAAEAARPLLSAYTLSASYLANYQSFLTDMQKNPEIIFFKGYEKDVFMNSIADYTCSSTQISGINLDALNAFLYTDGKPKASTGLDTSWVGTVKTAPNGSKYYYIGDLLAVRDARLSFITDTVAYYQDMTWSRAGAHQMTSSTGVGVRKFDNVEAPIGYRPQSGKNYVCAPIFWLSRVMCEYAEAKAELGTLTDEDLDATINKLYKRANLPAVTVASLNAVQDPANNMDVSSVVWEVRRNRRCELMLDGTRYWDLIRWHKLDLLDSRQHPDILLGINVTAPDCAPVANVDGYIDASKGKTRIYDKRYYFYPVPTGQIQLYENAGFELTQNPLW